MKKRIIILITSFIRLLRGEVSTNTLIKRGLKVGINFSRQGGVRIDTSYCFLIEIGDNVILAPNVIILAHDASLKYFCGLARIGRVTLGNNVFIGAGSIILPNVKIGNNVIVGAGSVVTKDIPNNCVYAGNPARFINSIEEIKKKNIGIVNRRPLYNRSYEPLTINEIKKNTMKQQLVDGVGFYQCDNFDNFNEFI